MKRRRQILLGLGAVSLLPFAKPKYKFEWWDNAGTGRYGMWFVSKAGKTRFVVCAEPPTPERKQAAYRKALALARAGT